MSPPLFLANEAIKTLEWALGTSKISHGGQSNLFKEVTSLLKDANSEFEMLQKEGKQ